MPLLLHLSPSCTWTSGPAISTLTSGRSSSSTYLTSSRSKAQPGPFVLCAFSPDCESATNSLTANYWRLYSSPDYQMSITCPPWPCLMCCSFPDVSSAIVQNEFNLSRVNKLVFLLFHTKALLPPSATRVAGRCILLVFFCVSSAGSSSFPKLWVSECLRDQTLIQVCR